MMPKFVTANQIAPVLQDQIWEIAQTSLNERQFEHVFTNTFLSWQKVEQNLFLIMNALVPSADNNHLSAMFHAVMSLDARLGMITAVAQLQLSEKHDAAYKEWGKLSDKVRTESKKRNRLAHFSLHPDKKDGLRLRTSTFDSRPSNKDYGVDELRAFQADFFRLEAKLAEFNWKLERIIPQP